MKNVVTDDMRRAIVVGGDADAGSSTAGMSVVHRSRALTDAERAELSDLNDRAGRAPVNPCQGQESYGDACRARSAWIASLRV